MLPEAEPIAEGMVQMADTILWRFNRRLYYLPDPERSAPTFFLIAPSIDDLETISFDLYWSRSICCFTDHWPLAEPSEQILQNILAGTIPKDTTGFAWFTLSQDKTKEVVAFALATVAGRRAVKKTRSRYRECVGTTDSSRTAFLGNMELRLDLVLCPLSN
jgi:hypothetical protein